MTNSQRLARILRRTPGEVAFDRCFFPLAAVCVFGVVFEAAVESISVQSRKERSEADLSSGSADHTWFSWGLFAVGLVLAFFWVRAAISVVEGWRDPSARVLRLAASGLLVALAWMVVRLLLAPFPG